MRLWHTQRAAVRRLPFTLIELLTVMLIVGILLAVTVPVVVKITSGSSVEAAARMVGSQLRLARQEAITRRKAIAVLFPSATAMGVPVEAKFQGFRACYVDSANAWTGWVENTAWTYLPVGAVVAEVDSDNDVQWNTGSTPNQPIDNTVTLVTNVGGTAANTSRAVVFRPTGRLPSEQRAVSVVEGVPLQNGTGVQPKNKLNWIDVRANQYTGRVTFIRPGA